jgi:chitin synthase
MLHNDPYQEYSPAPTPRPVQPPRRWKTVRKVNLYLGNFVLDCPVPPRLLNQIQDGKPLVREYTHMRYTAATCDPEDFEAENFKLRQCLFESPRRAELFIVITMYNEEDELLARTLIGVIQNIELMNSKTRSKTWGEDAWKKILVCIVSDGVEKINPRTRALLAAMGVYQEGIAKTEIRKQEGGVEKVYDTTAHIYEYTTKMKLEIQKGVVRVRKGTTPVQILFCLKQKNQQKINSHRWFFQAFAQSFPLNMRPNICVLIDAGTKPGKDSIYKLWKCFERNPNCAGACGEIKAMLGHGKNLINPLVATQNFEYKMSNILDKPLESSFGFITVLPGAFSAYRFTALQNDQHGHGPLEKYFAGEKMHSNAGFFTANMYLAEDRILCFELISKRNSSWILQYVKGSTGETDVPEHMAEFISQRRRWLNGSFFAAVYALAHFYQIWRSDHSFIRKIMFHIEFLYHIISMLFAWFALGNFFLVFRILTSSLGDPDLLGTPGKILSVVFEWAYLATLMTCFILALGNRPQGTKRIYLAMVYFWALIMCYLMFASVFITVKSVQSELKAGFHIVDLFKNTVFATLILSMASTYVLWLVVSILFLDPWHMITSFVQYLIMTPTYINILNVYAFCNTHDLSWGTKGDTKGPDLGKVEIGKDGQINISVPEEQDLNAQYEKELEQFAVKYKAPKKKDSPAEEKKDYYAAVRSGIVILWMFTNLALCTVVLSTGGFAVIIDPNSKTTAEQHQNLNAKIYLSVVLYSVAGLAGFRFLGAMWFLVRRMVSLLISISHRRLTLYSLLVFDIRILEWA